MTRIGQQVPLHRCSEWEQIRAAFLAPAAFLGLVASASQAQLLPDDTDGENTVRPKNFTVPGASQAVGQGLASAMMLEQRVKDYCWEYGCLVIVNETANYNITGFFVEMTGRDGGKRWGPNQFGEQLRPMKATFRFKTGDATACDRPVLFILKHRTTKEIAKIETNASLCKAPRLDSLVRIRMVMPDVRVKKY